MKKLLLFAAIFTGILSSVVAQSPEWLWAKRAGNIGYEYAKSMAVDDFGNTYIAGYFAFDLALDNSHTLYSLGSSDIFVAKCDPDGNIIWAKSAGGTKGDIANAIAVDSLGNCYVIGNFNSPSITFGSDTLNYVSGSVGSYDMFIAKFDIDGNVLWAKSAGGTGNDEALSVAIGRSGNPVVSGFFWSPAITFGATTLTHSGDQDLYITKYDHDGNVLWSKMGSGTGREWAYSITVDSLENCYVAGSMNSTTLTLGTVTLTKKANSDVCLIKYSPDGTIVWARNAGVSGDNHARSVATDRSGNIFMVGEFAGTSISFGTFTLINAGFKDIFAVKYSPDGTPLWANSSGGTKEDGAYSVATDNFGYCYVTGLFKSSAITIGSETLTNAGTDNSDVFISEYTPDGNAVWAKSVGGAQNDQSYAIAVDTLRNFYVTGYFSSPTIIFDATTLTNAGTLDIFYVKSSNSAISGINEMPNTITIPVYPNPANHEITVNVPLNAEIEIINIQGQSCKKFIKSTEENKLNIEDLPAGIYFVKVTSGQKSGVNKFVKQ